MVMKSARSAPPRNTAGPAPVRVPGSVRRTSSIDVSWPDGLGGNMRLVGRARDIVTSDSGGPPVTRAEDRFEASLKPDRTIVAIESDPPRPAMARLVGERGGGHLRYVLEEVVPEERRNATPLYLILDDISGVSLVAGFAWSQWDPNWLAGVRSAMSDAELEKAFKTREGICTGFAPGSSALNLDGPRAPTATAPDLRNPEDPEGWHAFTVQEGSIGMRRARRIDLKLDDALSIDAAFQDSATTPGGGARAVVHEYRLRAKMDPKSLRLLSIEAEPRILPFPECPSATANLPRLIGTPFPELREKVLAELRGTAGCTHLNDALRALADVPALACHLPG